MMRKYGNVAPTFWTGETGRALVGRGSEGVICALYLMTAPGSNMLGLYYQPLLYMAHETGLGIEGAAKGLQACVDVGFCLHDSRGHFVWVEEMGHFQIADKLAPADLRCKGVQNAYDELPDNPFLGLFFDKYAKDFHLARRREPRFPWGAETDLFGDPRPTPSEAPCKPGAGTGAGTGTGPGAGTGKNIGAAAKSPKTPAPRPDPAADAPATAKGTRLTASWKLPRTWGEWALEEYAQWGPDKVRLEGDKFRDHWVGKSGKDATKTDWLATWRNWCRNPLAHVDDPKTPAAPPPPEDRAARHAEVRAALGVPADDEPEIIDATR